MKSIVLPDCVLYWVCPYWASCPGPVTLRSSSSPAAAYGCRKTTFHRGTCRLNVKSQSPAVFRGWFTGSGNAANATPGRVRTANTQASAASVVRQLQRTVRDDQVRASARLERDMLPLFVSLGRETLIAASKNLRR